MSAVTAYGGRLVDDAARVEGVEMLGVDETSFLKATPTAATRWVSEAVDVGRRRVIDLFEGRNAADLDAWLETRPAAWKAAITVTVADLHEPLRASFGRHLGHATQVADPFHVVAVGTRAVDAVRRRIQNETLGHRGRKLDPLHRARKLLTLAAERLDPAGEARLRGLLRAGDPGRELYDTWTAKECLRDLYTLAADLALAAVWLDRLIDDLDTSAVTELAGMARTLRRWRTQIVAWHTTGASNGPAEAMNMLIKKIQTSRPRLPQLHQLPAPRPPLHRQLQLGTPRPMTPPERGEPLNVWGCASSSDSLGCRLETARRGRSRHGARWT
jgi:transposase